METLPVRSRQPGDGIDQPPEPPILPHDQSLGPRTNPMGLVASKF